MASGSDKHERTIVFAERAIQHIKALRQPAEPRDYEVWYCYATGTNPELNKAIDDALLRKSSLTEADIDALHGAYLHSSRGERIDSVGAKVVGEIDQVMAMIDAAVGFTTSYSESLADASQQLGRAVDREGLRAIVESLVETTREVERNNQQLEALLKASKREILQLQKDLEAVRNESLTDPLTTLSNRKYFDHALAKALAAKAMQPVSLMMLDIDHFKSFNDTYGHLIGDQVLRLVALCVKQNVKGQDIAARYGGEEFAVILPSTGLRDALKVADHIRRAVMAKELMKRSTGESLGRITVSSGVAASRPGDTLQSLIARADHCLYVAKRTGRNRVICETDPEAASAEPQVA